MYVIRTEKCYTLSTVWLSGHWLNLKYLLETCKKENSRTKKRVTVNAKGVICTELISVEGLANRICKGVAEQREVCSCFASFASLSADSRG